MNKLMSQPKQRTKKTQSGKLKVILCYFPVLHQGYWQLLDTHSDADAVLILGNSFAQQFKEIKKDIRRLDPFLTAKAIKSWQENVLVEVVEVDDFVFLSGFGKTNPDAYTKEKKPANKMELLFQQLDQSNSFFNIEIIMPNDQLMNQIADQYFLESNVFSLVYEPIFLRWDKHSAITPRTPSSDQSMSWSEFDQKIMKQAFKQAQHSSDWWRHIGAVIVKNGEIVILGCNTHLPTEHTPYFFNDVRSLFSRGQYFELVSSIHAEAATIAQAAKKGISLAGADMYVSTFPCPVCAKQVAQAGIKRLFYSGSYSMLDGEEILRAAGVELIQVELDEASLKEISQLEKEKSIVKKYQK